MKKYNIEGNIDFYDELYKSLDENDEDVENICLITNEKLTDKFVELKCGHKFNYIPLYNDLINYKFKYNHMESQNNKLKYNEIRCPYCRSKQNELLPYYDDINIQKYHGINFIDEKLLSNIGNYKTYNPLNKCCYKDKNIFYDETKAESETNTKYLECYNYGYPNNTCSVIYSGNSSYKFCSYHQKIIIKEHNDKIKQKLKEEKQKLKEEKQKIKEEEKMEKMKQKQLLKAQKDLEKENKKLESKNKKKNIKNKEENKNEDNDDINSKNTILGPVNIVVEGELENNLESIQYCIEIVKSGKNKGSTCCFKQYQDNLCKRHYNQKNKLNEKLNIVIESIKNMDTEINIDNNNINN